MDCSGFPFGDHHTEEMVKWPIDPLPVGLVKLGEQQRGTEVKAVSYEIAVRGRGATVDGPEQF